MRLPKPLLKFARGLFAAPVLAGLGLLAQAPPMPGPEHEHLKRLAGDWSASFKGEGGAESKGTMSVKVECGGLWAFSDFHAEFAGQKFQGRGVDGYDPVKKKYVSVWVDSLSTIPMFLEGTMDAATQTLTMTGEGRGPDGKPMKFKSETRFPDNDHMTFTMSVIGADGKPMPMMTIEYTRKQ